MKRKCGIILLERNEIIIRIYEADGQQWRLLYYQSKQVAYSENHSQDEILAIVEALSECFSANYAQSIGEWKTCARFLPQVVIQTISKATGLAFENLTRLREQELLCKGMFTELW